MKRQIKISILAALLGVTTVAHSEQIGLNYDRISFLEEPLAKDVGGVTLLLNGAIDARYTYEDEADLSDGNVVSAIQVSAQKQLKNALTVGATYLVDYDDADAQDEAAVFVSGVWGRFAAGNVTETTRNKTARMEPVANGEVVLDDFYAQLDDYGVAYEGRYSAHTVNAVVDKDGDFDVGVTYERPIDNKDYRLSMRYQNAHLDAQDTIDSQGLELLAELIYGSSLMDVSLGAEQIENDNDYLNRWYVGAGITHKFNALTLSVAGQLGQIEQADEKSATVAMRYDIARGLSANFAVNHADVEEAIALESIFEGTQTEYIVSLRYAF